MKGLPLRRLALIASVLFGAAIGGVMWTPACGWKLVEDRIYRVGWDPDPPFQVVGADGQPTGMAIELLREAAKRRGIRIEWVRQPGGADAALRDRKVDLWPLITILPERSSYAHITEPYLETEHCFLVHAESPYREVQDLAGALISYHNLRVNERNVRLVLPSATFLANPDTRTTIEKVCEHSADAAFVDEYTAVSALLSGLSCSGHEMRLIDAPQVTPRLGVGSTFAASAAADAIRKEIGKIAGEGRLPKDLSRWSYFSRRNLESMQLLREAKWRQEMLAGMVLALIGGIVSVGWLTARMVRQERRASKAESDLDATQRSYRLLTEQAPEGVFLADKDGKFLLVNVRLCEMLGYTNEEMRELTLLDTYPRSEREPAGEGLGRIACGTSTRLERYMQRKDGTGIPVEESIVRLEDGSAQGIVRDITERRRIETALRESEERFRNLADSAPVMMWVSGPDKVITFFNKTWLKFVGRRLDQELNNRWVESVHPDDLKACFTAYSSAFDARANFQAECRLRRADGEYRWVLCTGVPRFAPDGAFAGYVGSDIDITDLKRAQEQDSARQRLESVGVLAGGIAHDFNNLLGGILANSELALAELPAHSPASGPVEAIKEVADRAAEIVRQMMAYAGQENPVLEPVDVSHLVGEMIALLQVSISKTAILKIDLPGNLPAVSANPSHIRQVVMNLITNASEAIGEKGGVITVATSVARLDGSSFALPKGDYVRLEISDTGSGMTEEICARIFDPYFTTKFAGRGWGLAAVQGIVRGHGGTINVTSRPHQGSRFEVLLPCISEAPQDCHDIATPAATAESTSFCRTALLVEDEDHLRFATSTMLRKQGLTVIEADNGLEAVDLFQANHRAIDVVLLDLTLPGISGRAVLEELRRIQPDVKVIITSAYSQDHALGCIAGQPCRYIRKPYRLSGLLDLFREICSGQKEMSKGAAE